MSTYRNSHGNENRRSSSAPAEASLCARYEQSHRRRPTDIVGVSGRCGAKCLATMLYRQIHPKQHGIWVTGAYGTPFPAENCGSEPAGLDGDPPGRRDRGRGRARAGAAGDKFEEWHPQVWDRLTVEVRAMHLLELGRPGTCWRPWSGRSAVMRTRPGWSPPRARGHREGWPASAPPGGHRRAGSGRDSAAAGPGVRVDPEQHAMAMRTPRRQEHPVDHAQRTALHHRTHPVPGC